ncbi:MAG: SMC-Scp complex subunit ScpB [Bacteroidetes bacterium]|nr:SMC-Scp complex subunit ScpB [Bacteroidota bacterium]
MSYLPDEEEKSENSDNHLDGERNQHRREVIDNEPAHDDEITPHPADNVDFSEFAQGADEEQLESSGSESAAGLTPSFESGDPANGEGEHGADESCPGFEQPEYNTRSGLRIFNGTDETAPQPESVGGAIGEDSNPVSDEDNAAEPVQPDETVQESPDENIEKAAEEGEPVEASQTEGEEQHQPNPQDGKTEPAITDENVAESAEEANSDEEKKAELVDRTLDGIGEIVKADEEVEGAEADLREESVDELAHIIEAIVFASDEPLTANTIKSVLDASHTFGRLNADMISDRINALNNKYESEGSGFRIVEIANGYQFATRKEMAQWVSNLFKERSKRKLSTSALESLAIIAYKQPITKPEIESIRGVNVDYVLHNLLEKELVTVVGRAETVGRPLLYGTTQKFLKIFALKSLDDLPKLREIDEIIKEIKSKGAEESIQLEITALSDQTPSEDKAEAEAKPENREDNATDR